MRSSIVQFRNTPVRILVLCADRNVGKPVAEGLRNPGTVVSLAEEPELALSDIEDFQPDVVWAIATGDDAFRVGQFCRLAAVANAMCSLSWNLFWVGKDQPEGLSILTGGFSDLPQIEQMLSISRGRSDSAQTAPRAS